MVSFGKKAHEEFPPTLEVGDGGVTRKVGDAVWPQIDEEAMAKKGRVQPFNRAATRIQMGQWTSGRKRWQPPQPCWKKKESRNIPTYLLTPGRLR